MLKASPVAGAEEFAIHDHEGFGGVEIAEYASIGASSRSPGSCARAGCWAPWCWPQVGGDLEAAHAPGRAVSWRVRQSGRLLPGALTEETTVIPDALRLYIDYEAMARDARLSGEVFTVETAHDEVHVFWTR
jgi:hypothetical protein